MIINIAAVETGQLAHKLAEGYYALSAALYIAANPKAVKMAPAILPGQIVPIGKVKSKDGNEYISYHFTHYLSAIKTDPLIASQVNRVWLTGALLSLGDKLAENQYFDRAPKLELIRHLRNGIAHGNRFKISSHKNLLKHPANNYYYAVMSTNRFEITSALNGQLVLFDFIEAGDLVTLFDQIYIYLNKIGNGEM